MRRACTGVYFVRHASRAPISARPTVLFAPRRRPRRTEPSSSARARTLLLCSVACARDIGVRVWLAWSSSALGLCPRRQSGARTLAAFLPAASSSASHSRMLAHARCVSGRLFADGDTSSSPVIVPRAVLLYGIVRIASAHHFIRM